MPRLDDRLKAVAQQIRAATHADIGTDHAHLLKALLVTNRIRKGIAIENKTRPLENARQTLSGLNCDVRLANGLNGLAAGEVDSLSICGMGGAAIVSILETHPDRVPQRVVLQPNRSAHLIRLWGLRQEMLLTAECMIDARRFFQILVFEQPSLGHSSQLTFNDPVYQSTDDELAIEFGPLLLLRRDPLLRAMLLRDFEYLRALRRRTPSSEQRLRLTERAIELF